MQLKKHKGSVLVVTMMILGIVLTTALSVSVVSLKERKASIGASSSNRAYQVADTGIETVMAAILTKRDDTANDGNDLGPCNAGKITGNGYVVELKKYDPANPGTEITAACTDTLGDIIAIKSVGTASQSQRAIEAAVAVVVDWIIDPSCPNIAVYRKNSASARWKTTQTACVDPQCATGLDVNYPGNFSLVADNGQAFGATYPAREACKVLGGRLPTMAELSCMYANRTRYGDTFFANIYLSATESSTTTARCVSFTNGSTCGAFKTSVYSVRCVQD